MQKGNETASADAITVRVASTVEDIIACHRIRAACFMSGEEPEPYAEQFDGNDFSAATHLLAFKNGQPVGSMRIRILSAGSPTVGTWEKLSVLPSERGPIKILNALAQGAIAYSVFKKIDMIRGLVRDPRIMKFWERTVNGVITNDPPIRYEDREYRHILIDLRERGTNDPGISLEKSEPEEFSRRTETFSDRKAA